eukprot:scaffold3.g6692.t1
MRGLTIAARWLSRVPGLSEPQRFIGAALSGQRLIEAAAGDAQRYLHDDHTEYALPARRAVRAASAGPAASFASRDPYAGLHAYADAAHARFDPYAESAAAAHASGAHDPYLDQGAPSSYAAGPVAQPAQALGSAAHDPHLDLGTGAAHDPYLDPPAGGGPDPWGYADPWPLETGGGRDLYAEPSGPATRPGARTGSSPAAAAEGTGFVPRAAQRVPPPPRALVAPGWLAVPPQRFLHVPDDMLLSYFARGEGPHVAGQMAALQRLLDGLTSQDLAPQRQRLQGLFSHFSLGGLTSLQSSEAQRPAAHQALVDSKEEWEAATTEDFLLSLPLRINWEAMDDQLLKRYWAAHPEERQARGPRPCLSLPLRAHLDPAAARSSRCCHASPLHCTCARAEMLFGFLLRPISNALQRLTGQKPTSAVHDPSGAKAGGASTDSEPAVQEGSLQHEARVVVERRTLSRMFPNASSLLRNLFGKVHLQEACFKEVVVLYRRTRIIGTAGVQMEGDERNLEVWLYRGIPLADLELVLPGEPVGQQPDKTILVPPSVKLQLGATAALAVAGLGATLMDAVVSLEVLGGALALLATRSYAVYRRSRRERETVEMEVNRLLLNRVGSGQEGVLAKLCDEVCRQRVRELLVAYCTLRVAEEPQSEGELGRRHKHSDLNYHYLVLGDCVVPWVAVACELLRACAADFPVLHPLGLLAPCGATPSSAPPNTPFFDLAAAGVATIGQLLHLQAAVAAVPGAAAYHLVWTTHLRAYAPFADRYYAGLRVAALLAALPVPWVAAATAAQAALAQPGAALPPPRLEDALAALLPRLGWRIGGRPVPLSALSMRAGTDLLLQVRVQQRRATYHAPFAALALDAPAGPVEELSELFRRLWRIRWENKHKEPFWRLVYNAHPTAARLHLEQPCQCGAAPPADRHHHYWACPMAQTVVAAISAAAAARQPLPAPLAKANIWLARPPPAIHAGVWDIACLAAVAAMDHGRRRMYALSVAPPVPGAAPAPPHVVCARSAVARFWSLLADFVALRCAPRSWAPAVAPDHPFICYDPASSSFRVHRPTP